MPAKSLQRCKSPANFQSYFCSVAKVPQIFSHTFAALQKSHKFSVILLQRCKSPTRFQTYFCSVAKDPQNFSHTFAALQKSRKISDTVLQRCKSLAVVGCRNKRGYARESLSRHSPYSSFLLILSALLEAVSYADRQNGLVEVFYEIILKLHTDGQLVRGINFASHSEVCPETGKSLV